MLLSITSTTPDATDLGFVLHKHPDRVRTVGVGHGKAHVFYPEASPHRCTASLLVEIDPIALSRRRRGGPAPNLEPYGNDQMFNALRVVQLGAGAAVHPHRATADGIARVLRDKVLSRAARERAAELARRLAHEQGLARACERLHEWHPARGGTAGRPQA